METDGHDIKISLRDNDLVEHIISRATEEANNRVVERESRRRQSLAIIFTVLGLVGVSAAVTLANLSISSAVKTELDYEFSTLTSELDGIATDIRDQAALFNIQALATTIHEAHGFTVFEERRILESLENISQSESARSAPSLGLILERLTDSFLQADRISAIARIDQNYREILLAQDQQVPLICIAFAKGVVGGASVVGADPYEELYKLYCDRTAEAGYPEVGLFWKILNNFRKSEREQSESVTRLVKQIPSLSPEDSANFFNLLETFSDPKNWQSEPTAQAVEIGAIVNDLKTKYPSIRSMREEF